MATSDGVPEATVAAKIATPEVPAALYVEVPGVQKRSKVPLTEFDAPALERVGAAWTRALLAKAGHSPGAAPVAPGLSDDPADDED